MFMCRIYIHRPTRRRRHLRRCSLPRRMIERKAAARGLANRRRRRRRRQTPAHRFDPSTRLPRHSSSNNNSNPTCLRRHPHLPTVTTTITSTTFSMIPTSSRPRNVPKPSYVRNSDSNPTKNNRPILATIAPYSMPNKRRNDAINYAISIKYGPRIKTF